MQVYQVGGAVRDQILGREVNDCDWVVVGETVDSMLACGFQPIGKDFPVFLHPKTKEEYALARTERKISKGYHGFEFYAASDVTLVEDLSRRDLTINAIAFDVDKQLLVDPYGGQMDCEKKILRHVSSAFVEDPVRVLRLARFSALLPDFTIAEETKALVATMVDSGEMNALVPERVWQECEKAMHLCTAMRFFQTLSELGVLDSVLPPLGFIAPVDWQQWHAFTPHLHQPEQRFALIGLAMDLPQFEVLQQYLKMPKDYAVMLCWVIKYQEKVQAMASMMAETILALLYQLDFWRRPERFFTWLHVILVVTRLEQEASLWQSLACQCRELDIDALFKENLYNSDKAKVIRSARFEVIQNFLDERGKEGGSA